MIRSLAVIPLAFGFAFSPVFAAEKKPRAANPPAAPARVQGGANQVREGRAQIVDRLLKMTPAERERALSALPPARRENIEKRLGEIGKMAPAQQNRLLNRAEILLSLPPERANQIRSSARQFQLLPAERRPVLNREMNRMMRMPDDERREYLNSDQFRSRYSPEEQRMMQDLMEIRPRPQP